MHNLRLNEFDRNSRFSQNSAFDETFFNKKICLSLKNFSPLKTRTDSDNPFILQRIQMHWALLNSSMTDSELKRTLNNFIHLIPFWIEKPCNIAQ